MCARLAVLRPAHIANIGYMSFNEVMMDEKALFTNFWTNEAVTTRNVLARIPEASTYKPDPKSRTAQEIAWQIVCEEKMIIEALESGTVAWNPPPMPESMREVLPAYQEQSRTMPLLPADVVTHSPSAVAAIARAPRTDRERSRSPAATPTPCSSRSRLHRGAAR